MNMLTENYDIVKHIQYDGEIVTVKKNSKTEDYIVSISTTLLKKLEPLFADKQRQYADMSFGEFLYKIVGGNE